MKIRFLVGVAVAMHLAYVPSAFSQAPVVAPNMPVLAQVSGPFGSNSLVGDGAFSLGDVNGDGLDDIIVSAPGQHDPITGAPPFGEIRCLAGPDFSTTLYSIIGVATPLGTNREGLGLRVIGDLSNDGIPDFVSVRRVLTLPTFADEVVVYSGADGTELHQTTTWTGGAPTNTVGVIGDFDGDGVPDYVSNAALSGGGGYDIIVHSGVDGHILQQVLPAGNFFACAAILRDIDNDGLGELLVSTQSPGGQIPATTTMAIRLSGQAMGYHENTWTAPVNSRRPVTVADRDGDGSRDVLVGIPVPCGSPATIELRSGITGALLDTLSGLPMLFGHSQVTVVPDSDGDGVEDLSSYYRISQASPAGIVDYGGTVLVSGRDPQTYLFQVPALVTNTSGVASQCPVIGGTAMSHGDFNGDGRVDWIERNPYANGAQGEVIIYEGTTLFDQATAAGNVLGPQGFSQVLGVAASNGGLPSTGGATKTVTLNVGERLEVWMARPLLSPSSLAQYAVFGRIIQGGTHVTWPLPAGIGDMVVRPAFAASYGGDHFTLANTFGSWPALTSGLLAVSPVPGDMVTASGPIPVPVTFWLQGVVADGSPSGLSVTNAIRVVVK